MRKKSQVVSLGNGHRHRLHSRVVEYIDGIRRQRDNSDVTARSSQQAVRELQKERDELRRMQDHQRQEVLFQGRLAQAWRDTAHDLLNELAGYRAHGSSTVVNTFKEPPLTMKA